MEPRAVSIVMVISGEDICGLEDGWDVKLLHLSVSLIARAFILPLSYYLRASNADARWKIDAYAP